MKRIILTLISLTIVAFFIVYITKQKEVEIEFDFNIVAEKQQKEYFELPLKLQPIKMEKTFTRSKIKIDISGTDKVKEFYQSGNLKRITKILNQKPHGIEIMFYDNSHLTKSHELSYFAGTKHGRQLTFHENGSVKGRVFFQDGIMHGDCTSYYKNEQIKQRVKFKNNIKTGIEEYFSEDGTLVKKIEWLDGGKNKVVWKKSS